MSVAKKKSKRTIHAEIESNPKVMLGKPVIRGTRITVEFILELLGSGDSVDDILESYPHLTRHGIQAAIVFAKDVLRNDVIYPLAGSDE